MEFITVNMHCHSSLSDGQLSPEELAAFLSENNVQVASLTDHDTLEGLPRFRSILKERGIGFISGIEITAFSEWGELHLLGYNFDIDNRELNEEFSASNRKIPHYSRVMKLVHNAGGKIFLAHPLTLSENMEELEKAVIKLKENGLDGIEAVYSAYSRETEKKLKTIADKNNLLISAGTDYHGKTVKHLSRAVLNIDIKDWIKFRDGLGNFESGPEMEYTPVFRKKNRLSERLQKFLPLFKIIFPAVAGIILFTYSIFNLFIPETENILLSRKKEMIKELTHSAISILDEFNSDFENGSITIEEAESKAAAVISHIRYGKENKDYFWITNLDPVMIAHPYRKDLVGSNLSSYTDINGEYVFLKIVETVKEKSEGYVEYQWQWKDEAGIVAPKISYVKIYEKWGWIVGTGIYIDDVMSEINKLEKYLIDISLFITMLLFLILLIIVLQNIKKEKILRENRLRLQKSDEKYRALADRTNEGTLIVQNGKCTYSNPSVRKMLGYSENELLMMTATDLFPGPYEKDKNIILGEMLERGEITPSMTETEMTGKDGKTFPVLMETGRIDISGREGYIINIREISSRITISKSELRRNRLISELQSSLLFLSEPAFEISRQVPLLNFRTSIRNCAKFMTGSNSSALLVKSDSGEILGIVTDRDIRSRALAEERNPEDPVYTIMTSPVRISDSRILIFEAISVMKTYDINHLVLDNRDNETGCVIRAKDLIEYHKYPAVVTAGELESASSFSELQKYFSHVPYIIKSLIETGSRSRNIMRIVTTFTDILIKKVIETAIEELGPPPVKFAFIAPGSLGRIEQTLSSDQDNAIIFDQPESNTDLEKTGDYFVRLGEIVSDELNKAGFPYCSGGIMAKNRKWCRTLSAWKNSFSNWITKPEPEELLHFNMFFDYRIIHGDQGLSGELKKHISETMNSFPQFFLQLANSSSLYKAPVNLFGNIIFDSSAAKKIIDVKELVLPIVNFARLYSLKHGIEETNTFSRLDALMEKGIIHHTTHNELTHVYDFLNQLRLRKQAEAVSGGRQPDNMAEQGSLTHIENAMLKNAVNNITDLQKKINFDFKGSI